jgi:hypothetical protein
MKFSQQIFVIFFTKNIGKKFGYFLGSVNSTDFVKFFGKNCQIFNITTLERKKTIDDGLTNCILSLQLQQNLLHNPMDLLIVGQIV